MTTQTAIETPDEQMDRIRSIVNAELPRPAEGFENDIAEEEFRARHEARFIELCEIETASGSQNAEQIIDETEALLVSLTPTDNIPDDDSDDCLYLSAAEIADDLGL